MCCGAVVKRASSSRPIVRKTQRGASPSAGTASAIVATSIQRSFGCARHGGRRSPSNGRPRRRRGAAAVRGTLAAKKGWVASTTASVWCSVSQRTKPSAPPKPPIRLGNGDGRGLAVRPAKDKIASISVNSASFAASAEASAVPPRTRTRIRVSSPMPDRLSSPAAPPPWLSILGVGEDGRKGLSNAALEVLDAAEFVVGGARHLRLVQPIAAQMLAWPTPLSDAYAVILERRRRPTCVLATGDPFHYGVGAELARFVTAEEIVCYPLPSAFSLAAARLGWSLPDCECLSLHGRALERVIPYLQPQARILALSWDETTPGRLAGLLIARGFGNSTMTVLEAMGGPRERVRRTRSDDFDLAEIDPLNAVAIEVAGARGARVVTLASGLDDAWFENDGQLTKAEIRAVTLAALAPRAGQLLWDIGAGSGSVGIEWCLRHCRNRCIAIEQHSERAARIRRNAAELGVDAMGVIVGRAPEALAALPAPDAIFIGGGASDPTVFKTAWAALESGGRMAVNAVTLETEVRLADLFARHGGAPPR